MEADTPPRAPPRWLRALSPSRRVSLPRTTTSETPSTSSTRSTSYGKPPSLRKPTPPPRKVTPSRASCRSRRAKAPIDGRYPPIPAPAPRDPLPLLNMQHHAPLIHKILSFASRRLLLTFRQTSRSFRRKADALLAHHLVISSTPSDLVISSTLGPVPGLIWLPSYDGARTQMLLYSKVLDIRGPIESDDLADLGLGHIPTVRFRENSAGLRAQSCIDGPSRVVAFATLNPEGRGDSLCPVPETARSVTAMLRCFAGCPSPVPPFHHPVGLRNVVLIFRAAKRRAGRRRSSAVRDQQLGLVATLSRVILQSPVVRYTLVDVHLLDSANLGFPLLANFGGKMEEGYAQKKILEAVAAGIRREYPHIDEEGVSDALGGIEFIDRKEYKARVSAETLQLETVEDLARVSA